MRPAANRRATSYLEPGRAHRRRRNRPAAWLVVLALAAAVLASVVLLAQAAASESGRDCPEGAISAIGPVDARGRGDALPELACIAQ
jgi:hypothetical protein